MTPAELNLPLLHPFVVTFARRAATGALTWALAASAPGVASSDCGAYEDAVRTTHRALAWRDFKSAAFPRAFRAGSVVAYVSTSIALEPLQFELSPEADGTWTARLVEICVRAFMLKEGSGFLRHEARADDLVHEQGHFDITELFARSLTAQLGRIRYSATLVDAALEGARQRADRVVSRTLASWRSAQAIYDAETACSERVQVRWRRWISAKLDEAPEPHARRLAFSALPPGDLR
jgi:hypothetical protein